MDGHPGGKGESDLAARITALEAMLADRGGLVQSLRESEEQLRTILENSPDSITLLDATGKILYLNRTIPPRRVEDVIGTSAMAYLQPAQAALFLEKITLAIETRRPQLVEVETMSHHQWWQTRLVPILRDDRVVAVMGMGSDVTERRRAEEALRRSEEMLRLAAQAARMGLWAWDVAGDAFTLDEVSAQMIGYPGSVSGVPLAELIGRVHPEDRQSAGAAAASFAATGAIADYEFSVTNDIGAQRRLVVSGKRAQDSSLLIGGVFDVTERRLLEEQLRQAQKLEAVGQLTAGIAHNFNNLLTAIIPSVQLARRELPGSAGERLADAEYAAGRAAELVKQLMVFARHRRRPAKEHVDVRALVRRTVSICRATFDRGVELPVFEDPDVPSVLGEGGQIEQIFLNVFLNARDAFDSAHSSERVIRTHIDVVERARAGTAPLPCVRVRISDTGPGMSDAVRSRVFEPFFTTKDVGRGSGLGLATAYAIATDHGGMLSCESVVGEGTTFTLTIPAALDLEPQPTISPRGHRGGKETILVVDDERMVRKTVRSVLEPEGYRVLEATDGIEAFETFQRERGSVDLVLLDLSMPGIPGDAVLKSILRERPNARVVLFTGREPETLPIGATAMLQKPVQIDELLRVVRSVCDESGTGLT